MAASPYGSKGFGCPALDTLESSSAVCVCSVSSLGHQLMHTGVTAPKCERLAGLDVVSGLTDAGERDEQGRVV